MKAYCNKFKGTDYGECLSPECTHFYEHEFDFISCTSNCAGKEGNHCYTEAQLRKLKLKEIEKDRST